jgi:hypothetical protein
VAVWVGLPLGAEVALMDGLVVGVAAGLDVVVAQGIGVALALSDGDSVADAVEAIEAVRLGMGEGVDVGLRLGRAGKVGQGVSVGR